MRRSSTLPSPLPTLSQHVHVYFCFKLNRRTWVRFGFCNSKYSSMLISSLWPSNIIFLRCHGNVHRKPYVFTCHKFLIRLPLPFRGGWQVLAYYMQVPRSFNSSCVQLVFFPSGDGTPMDMWDFRGWKMIPQNKGLKEPQYLTPHLIRHINRDVKLLILLRNPVDR